MSLGQNRARCRAAPKKSQERFLQELRLQPAAEDAAAKKAPSLTLAEIEALVRKIVRQELGRLAGL